MHLLIALFALLPFHAPIAFEQPEVSIGEREEELPPTVDRIPTQSYEAACIKMVGSLVGLLVLFFLIVWVYKKLPLNHRRNTKGRKSIQIVEKHPLSAKSILYLVEVEGRGVLVAESQCKIDTMPLYPHRDKGSDLVSSEEQ